MNSEFWGHLFYSDIDKLLQIAITAPLIYVAVIIYIRIVGKRATSQLNSFDWIVTVAMGSLVASTIILEDLSLLDGLVAVGILLGLQYGLTKVLFNSKKARRLIKSTPQLLVFEGEYLTENMRKERIPEAEVLAAIRRSGMHSLDQIYAVVLETNANLAVIPESDHDGPCFSLGDVHGLPDGLRQDLKERGVEDDTASGPDQG